MPEGMAQTAGSEDFRWGNGYYYNLNVGESVIFNDVEVKLVQIVNHYNQLKIGEDTLWLKVARRSVPAESQGVRVFVADNRSVKSLTPDSGVHSLLTKDALICLSQLALPLLDPLQYSFPVSFNNGFTWNAEEDSHPFSFYKTGDTHLPYLSYAGVGFNMNDAKGRQRHWLVALENSKVVWIENQGQEGRTNSVCVLLESESQSGIYYWYNGLFNKNTTVKKGQKLMKGEAIGTAWGDESWGHVQIAVICTDKEPDPRQGFTHVVNGFPQLFGLYFQQNSFISRSFSRGRIVFGKPRGESGNQPNIQEFENHTGKGWVTGKWNPADKVEWITSGNEGNVRLKKVLFEGTPAQSENPTNFFDYQIAVKAGVYRIRAKMGDLFEATWQKVEFEGITAAVKSLEAGEFDWTPERVVNVTDGTLTIRIFINPEHRVMAGLSEIVFQRVN